MLLEEPQTSAPWGGLEEAGSRRQTCERGLALEDWERELEDITSGDYRLQPGKHLMDWQRGVSGPELVRG